MEKQAKKPPRKEKPVEVVEKTTRSGRRVVPVEKAPRDKTKVRKQREDDDYDLADYVDQQELAKRVKVEEEPIDAKPVTHAQDVKTRQPSLITGGVMRDYQLAGMEWMVSLFENGLNGILADEMGLGKTLQTIAFFAYLMERNVRGPYLVVAPLSTIANWVCEFERFAPDIPVILYHGSPDERQHMRNKKLVASKQKDPSFPVVVTSYEIVMNDRRYLQACTFSCCDGGRNSRGSTLSWMKAIASRTSTAS
jgi:ATP-dependent DNA helicase